MNVHDGSIGIFDSGLGGLSVVREVEALLPHEHILYAADSRYCPYGSRTPAEIITRTLTMTSALIERGAKVVVIACNTATAYALEAVRSTFDLPIIGLEPALKPAVALTRNGRVGVLATPRTASSGRMERLIERYAGDTQVQVVPARGFVELVESGETGGPAAERLVRQIVTPLLETEVDTVVLGCTHYPFLHTQIQSVMGEAVKLIDSGSAIARRTDAVLKEFGLMSNRTAAGTLRLLTTGEAEEITPIAARLLDRPLTVEHLPAFPEVDGSDYACDPPKLSAACTISVSAGA